jgi:hypothetical protein
LPRIDPSVEGGLLSSFHRLDRRYELWRRQLTEQIGRPTTGLDGQIVGINLWNRDELPGNSTKFNLRISLFPVDT